MALLIALGEKAPRVAEGVYLAPNAVLIGDVEVAAGASIWFGAVLRADMGPIRIGPGTAVEDNSVVHANTEIGANVILGHSVVVEGCVIEEGAVIGSRSVVLMGARIGRRAMVAAGSVVTEGMAVPPATLVAGAPAQVKKPLGGSSRDWVERAARNYQELGHRYLREARPLPGGRAD